MEYLLELFNTDGFPPRWYCGSAWTPLLGWTHILSDFAIFLSYTTIPLSLIFLIWNRKDFPFTPILWLFAGFILLCGLSHLVEASIFWIPWYRFSGLVKFLTAVISIFTAIVLIKHLPLAISIPALIQRKEDLEKIINQHMYQEKFYEDFYENAPDMFASIDNDRKIIKCNNKLVEVLGYKKQELIGKKVLELYHPDCLEEVRKGVKLYDQQGYLENIEVAFIKKDGTKVPVILNLTPVKDEQGKLLHKRAVWRDVSNLHDALKQIKTTNHILLGEQGKLRSMTHRLNAVLNSVADGVMTINKYGIIESFNRAAESIFGYIEEEIIGKHVEILRETSYSDEEKAYFIKYLEGIVEKGTNDKKEVNARRKNNSIFPCELSVNEAQIEGETKYICSIRDISSRKEIENRLNEAYSRIQKINTDLISQNRQYESMSKRLNAVLNGTADAIVTISDQGIIESFNYAAEKMYGYREEEIVGKSTTILHPVERFNPEVVMEETLKTLVTEVNSSKQEVCVKKDGTRFNIEYLLAEVVIDNETKFIGSVRDITEQKKMDLELKNAYQEVLIQKQQLEALSNRLNAVLNGTADGIITINADGIIESFNNAATQIFGYIPEEVVGKNSTMLNPPERFDPAKIGEDLKTLVTEINESKQELCIRKDGTIFPVEYSLTESVIDGETKFIASTRDISERKKIEGQLKAAFDEVLVQKQQLEGITNRLNAVLNSTADAIITISNNGIIESFNHSAERIFGYTAEEIVGNSANIFTNELETKNMKPEEYEQRIRAVVTQNEVGVEKIVNKKDGLAFPVEFLMNEVLIDNQTKFIASVRDISHRKQMEAKLSQTYDDLLIQKKQFESISKRLAVVLNSTAEAILTINSEGLLESFNSAAEFIFGYKAEEVIGKPNEILAAPENLRSVAPDKYDEYLRSFTSKTIGIHNESVCQRKDGTLFPVEFTLNEIEIEGKTKFISSIRDISHRKQIESKLKTAYTDLEEFVYIASHDLKEPLRGIHNYATFLIEDYENIIDKDGKDKLYTLKYLTTRLDKFIDDLLYYSRVGKTELSIKKVNLNELVKDVIESLKITIKEKNIEIKLHKLPSLVCDETRVAEVFRNLVTNAMKYNDKEEKWIDIGCNLVENIDSKPTYVFYVKDNGIGIPDKYYDVIFKIFKRLHGREKFGGGSGAGLTIVKKIVNQHGGKIWVESVNKEGTTFYFTLQEDNNENERALTSNS